MDVSKYTWKNLELAVEFGTYHSTNLATRGATVRITWTPVWAGMSDNIDATIKELCDEH